MQCLLAVTSHMSQSTLKVDWSDAIACARNCCHTGLLLVTPSPLPVFLLPLPFLLPVTCS